MARLLYRALPLFVLFAVVPVVVGQDLVDNPMYKFWSKSKPGAFVVFKETTKLSGEAAGSAPEGIDHKTVTYKLTKLTDDKAIVETRVIQQEDFGFVETAPTKHIYPAKMSKAALEDLIEETGAKGVKVTLKVGDKEFAVKTIKGTKKRKGEEVDFQVWLCDEIPGGIAKRHYVTKVDGKVVAETTVEVKGFKAGGEKGSEKSSDKGGD